MIPEFPEFKQLELSDKAEVEALTSKYPPYSDFEFTSLYAWDVQEQTKLSWHHGNLIVRFTDYITDDIFYTFIGTTEVNDTAKQLLDLSIQEGVEPKLKLIPDVTAQLIDTKQFIVAEDRDNFDYLIKIEVLKKYGTKDTRARKKSVKKFIHDFPEHTVFHPELSDQHTVEQIRYLVTHSNTEHPEREVTNELIATTRLLKNIQAFNHLRLGIDISGTLVAFVICDVIRDGIAMGHFIKARRSVSPHLYSYVLQTMANMLHEKGCMYLNFEQDLGLEGLRKWKMSFGTPTYLKKHIVSFTDVR